jgi:hypothetical protein
MKRIGFKFPNLHKETAMSKSLIAAALAAIFILALFQGTTAYAQCTRAKLSQIAPVASPYLQKAAESKANNCASANANLRWFANNNGNMSALLSGKGCRWTDIGLPKPIETLADLGCGSGNPAPANQPDEAAPPAPIPVYVPWGGYAYQTLTVKKVFEQLASFLTRAYKSASARKTAATGEDRKDDMQVLADGFMAGNDFALDKAKKLGDNLALHVILANRAFSLIPCKWKRQAAIASDIARKTVLEAEVTVARAAVTTAEGPVTAKSTEITTLQARIAPVQAEITRLNTILQNRRLRRQHRATRAALTAKQRELAPLTQQLNRLNGEKATLESQLSTAKATLDTKKGELEAVVNSIAAATAATRLVCKDDLDKKYLSVLVEFLRGITVDKDVDAIIKPLLAEAAATDSADKRLYIIWYVISLLPPGNIAFLTDPPTPFKDTRGLATRVNPGKLGKGDLRICQTPDGSYVTTEDCPAGSWVYKPLFDRATGLNTGLRLELAALWGIGVSNPSHQKGNGFGGFTLGVSRKFTLAKRLSLAPFASVGWIYVTGESDLRRAGEKSPSRNAAIITAGVRVYVKVAKNWDLFASGSAIVLPERGGSVGVGVSTRVIPRVITEFEMSAIFLPDTGVCSGYRWGSCSRTGNVGLGKGLQLTLRFLF